MKKKKDYNISDFWIITLAGLLGAVIAALALLMTFIIFN